MGIADMFRQTDELKAEREAARMAKFRALGAPRARR